MGYRHGNRQRTLTTSLGATTIAMPLARIEDDDRRRLEWRSQLIPRYQRRTGLLSQQAPENTAAPPAIQLNRPTQALRNSTAQPAIVSAREIKSSLKRGTSASAKK
jgi:hypothetical protein